MSFTRAFDGYDPRARDSTQPRFFMDAYEDVAASQANGRPIFKQRELVQLMQPGSSNQPVFEVNDEYRQRWPEQYARFKQGLEHSIEGTPLEQWPVLNKPMVLELKALQIFTVEQLAGMSDVHLQQIRMGGRRLRELAKAFLDEAEHQKLLTETLGRNERLETEMAELRRQNEEQRVLLERVSAQLIDIQNRPHPLETYVPGVQPTMHAPAAPAASALESLPAPRRRRSQENGHGTSA